MKLSSKIIHRQVMNVFKTTEDRLYDYVYLITAVLYIH